MNWKFIFYDWGGLNATLFQLINQDTPAALMPVAWFYSNLLGNYWTTPLFILGLWAWSRTTKEAERRATIQTQLASFVVAFVLGIAATTLLKILLDFPRPLAVYGDQMHAIGVAAKHYSLPSGHSSYAALIAGTLWPLAGVRLRLLLVVYVVSVGWSRIALGMHFPADVLAGWALGAGCIALTTRIKAVAAKVAR